MTEYRNSALIALAVAAIALLTACSAPSPAGAAPYAPPPNPPRPADCAPPRSPNLTTATGWIGQTAARPDDVAFVVDDGRGNVVSHRADQPMPLASAVKVVHLAAYGRAVAQGVLRPDETVPVADWERWYLPTDGGAHQQALARLRPAAGTVTVDAMVSAMIQESDNAAADWLRARLGDPALTDAAAGLGWAPFDLPSELGGAIALVLPDQAPPLDAPREVRGPAENALARRFADDPGFAASVRAELTSFSADVEPWLIANEQWAPRTAAGTAAQLAGAYRALSTGEFGAGSDVAQRHLQWLGPQRGIGTLGFKGGAFLTVATFGSWLRRDDGSTAHAVVLGRGIPRDVDPNLAGAAQLRLAVGAVDDPKRFASLACVA